MSQPIGWWPSRRWRRPCKACNPVPKKSAKLECGELASQVIARAWDEISIYGTPASFLRKFRRAPEIVGHLFATQWCNSEICNGGLLQFFHNSTGVLAPEALAGYRALGLKDVAGILAKAMREFGASYPRARGKRWQALGVGRNGDWPEVDPFDALTDRYFAALKNDRYYKAADALAARYLVAYETSALKPKQAARKK